MDKYIFRIADRTLAVEADDMEPLKPYLDGFGRFVADGGGAPVLTFTLGPLDAPMPGSRPVHAFDLNDSRGELYRSGDGWQFVVRGGDVVESRFVFDPAARRALCQVEGVAALQNLKFVVWMAFGLATLPAGLVSVHSSVVVYDGRAVMFLGESGTGKSTHTSLWLRHIEGARLLNDDSPLVDVSRGGVLCCGSPWSGKGRCYVNESYPLAAIVRLSQAPHNRISRLDKLRAIGALWPSCPPSFAYDERMKDLTLDIVSAVVAAVPVFSLECLPDEAAARLSKETVMQYGADNR